MFNQFKPAQKDSSCLNSRQVSSPLEYNNSYGGMKGNMGDMNMNKNCSSSLENNSCNLYAVSSHGINNSGGDDEINWLQEALTNPQLAGSANVFLQTMNYINTCSASNENQTNSSVYSGSGDGSYNMSNIQAQMNIPVQLNGLSNNFTNTNSSNSCQTTPINSFQGGQNYQNSYGRQEAGTSRSLSSDTTKQTAGAANLNGNTFSNLNFSANNTPVQYSNTTGFQQRQQHHQQRQQPNNNSMDIQTLQLLQQKSQYQTINQPANYLQQQTQNQNLSNWQQHQGSNQVANQMLQQQQLLLQQQYMQNQSMNNSTSNFNNDFFANVKHMNSAALGGQSQNAASMFDDVSNLEPEDFCQQTCEEHDLSFLLDDTSPVEFIGGHSNSNNTSKGMGGSSGLANGCTVPAPASTTANNRPQPTTQADSLPGSSQQMQEHLREITQQHMQQFQMPQVERQLKQSQKQRSKQKKTLQAKLSTEETVSSKGPKSPTPRNNEKKPQRETSKSNAQVHAGNLAVNSDTEQPVNFDTMIPNQGNNSTNYNAMNSSQHSAPPIMGTHISGVEMTLHPTSQGSSTMNSMFSNSMDNINGNRYQYLPVVGGGAKRKQEASTGAPCSRMSEMKSLYEYFESMLSSRGYSLIKLPAKEIGYMSQPSPLQSASFGFAICSSIKAGGAGRLAALLSSGLSPNPTNKFGDSPFFLACKRGLHELVKTFVDNGADVRVADGFGRTPLHHVAWSNDPCFTSAKILLEADARLILVADNFGKTPLDFVGDSNRSVRSTFYGIQRSPDVLHSLIFFFFPFRLKWMEFFESVKDSFWPPTQKVTSYAPESKNGSAMPDPPNALSIELAEQVASGHVLPEEIQSKINCK